ncbi:MAG TPA: acyl-phosphate glycerol 3-phosphate acyltransferase [Desulfotomaculum sp.]|nr:acyl-phosphate glycerol 3-phosphate acyltransferase [Desulfotomaculum sp.]
MISYLIGSIPFGFLLARVKGVDIRKQGSGNIGATNVWRNMGLLSGLLVLILDALKGVVCVLLGRYFAGGDVQYLTAMASLAGNSWPVFLRFKGGKIIATALGVFLALDPLITGLAALIWLVIVALFRFVSLGSILAMISLPVFMLAFSRPWEKVIFSVIAAGIAIFKHLPNIKRLLSGTETKIGR